MTWNALGVAQVNLGRTDEAISNYRHALELNPNFADAFTDLGSAFLTQGKYDEAIQMSEKALRLRPGVAETHEILGEALLNLRRVDESIFHNRKALELKPDLPGPQLNLGIALFAKGNYDEAIAHLEYVLRLNPQHEVAQKLLIAAQRKRKGRSANRSARRRTGDRARNGRSSRRIGRERPMFDPLPQCSPGQAVQFADGRIRRSGLRKLSRADCQLQKTSTLIGRVDIATISHTAICC